MIRRSLFALSLLTSLVACAAEPPAKAPAQAAPAVAAGDLDDAGLRKAMLKIAPGVEIGTVTPAPVPGFREVVVNGRIVYVSNDGKYLFQGALIDMGNRANLTAASEGLIRKDKLAQVGPERRIIFAADQPKHRVTVFTDIDCGYCRKLHQQIAEYNRLGITVEYLFFPRTGLGSESFEKAVSVWCAPDRRRAMTAAKAGLVLPKGTCSNPITQDYDLGRQIGLDGTPAIYSAEGIQLGGYVEPAELLARLDEMAAKQAP